MLIGPAAVQEKENPPLVSDTLCLLFKKTMQYVGKIDCQYWTSTSFHFIFISFSISGLVLV